MRPGPRVACALACVTAALGACEDHGARERGPSRLLATRDTGWNVTRFDSAGEHVLLSCAPSQLWLAALSGTAGPVLMDDDWTGLVLAERDGRLTAVGTWRAPAGLVMHGHDGTTLASYPAAETQLVGREPRCWHDRLAFSTHDGTGYTLHLGPFDAAVPVPAGNSSFFRFLPDGRLLTVHDPGRAGSLIAIDQKGSVETLAAALPAEVDLPLGRTTDTVYLEGVYNGTGVRCPSGATTAAGCLATYMRGLSGMVYRFASEREAFVGAYPPGDGQVSRALAITSQQTVSAWEPDTGAVETCPLADDMMAVDEDSWREDGQAFVVRSTRSPGGWSSPVSSIAVEALDGQPCEPHQGSILSYVFSRDGFSWIDRDDAGARSLWLADRDGHGGRRVATGEGYQRLGRGPAGRLMVEIVRDGVWSLWWLDPSGSSLQLRPVVMDLRSPWVTVGTSSIAAIGGGTLAVHDVETGASHAIASSTIMFGVGPAGSDGTRPIVYQVLEPQPSPRDGLWATRLPGE